MATALLAPVATFAKRPTATEVAALAVLDAPIATESCPAAVTVCPKAAAFAPLLAAL